MTNKIYLVRVSYLVPVVAESAIDAVQHLLEDAATDGGALVSELYQVCDGLNSPEDADPAHVQEASIMVEREVTAEDLEEDSSVNCWATAVPWGDEDDSTIEERLYGVEEHEFADEDA